MVRMHIRWHETPRSVIWIAALSVAVVNTGTVWASQPRLVTLTAATRLGETPPEGWTHLVMKSFRNPAPADSRLTAKSKKFSQH